MDEREVVFQEVTKIRQANLALLQSQYSTQGELAKVLDVNPTQLSQIKAGKSGDRLMKLGGRLARKFELKLGLPRGWFDFQHTTAPTGLPGTASTLPTPAPPASSSVSLARGSTIQVALVDTARRLTEAGLLSDLDCLSLLQSWSALIAQLPPAADAPE